MNRRFLFALLCLVSAPWLAPRGAAARTWHVTADGTGDAPTIKAAIDSAAAGDVIELACGTYFESHNLAHQLYPTSGLTIRGETGDPACVVIDAQTSVDLGSVFWMSGQSDIRFEGLTVTGGDAIDVFLSSAGGGFRIRDCTGIVLDHCVITGNRGRWGGGMDIDASEVTLLDCVVTGNTALVTGGGLSISGTFHAVNTVIADNTAPGEGADGAVDTGTAAVFTCCDLAPARWQLYGTMVRDDADCGPVPVADGSWGSLKALYR